MAFGVNDAENIPFEGHADQSFALFILFLLLIQHVDKGIKEGFAGRLKMNMMLVGRRFRPVPFKEDALERIAIVHGMRIANCIYNVNTNNDTLVPAHYTDEC